MVEAHYQITRPQTTTNPTDTMTLNTKASDLPVKSVNWSYPTSTNANRFKKPKGCWTISLTDWSSKEKRTLATKAVAAFDTEQEAEQAAEAMPQKWAGWAR